MAFLFRLEPSSKRLLLILGALTAFGSLSVDTYLPAFPQITRDLSARAGQVEFTLVTFLLGAGICQVLYGPLSDRFGRRRPLLVGCFLYVIGSLGCALAPSLPWLASARLLQALGGAAGMVIARAIVRDLSDEREAARMFSQLMLVMGAAPIFAPWFGGQLLRLGSWRFIFLVLAAFGLLCMAASAAFLPETLAPGRRSRGGVGATARTFLDLLHNRRFMGYTLAAGFGFASNFAYIAGSPFVFIELHHVSPQHFGYFFGANSFGLIGSAQINRLLLRRYSPEAILPGALGANLLAGLALAVCGATGWGGLPTLAVLLFVCLSTAGVAGPNLAASALAPYARNAGSASALLGASPLVIGSLSGVLVGVLHNGTALPMTGTVAACSLCAFLFLRFLAQRGGPESGCLDSEEDPELSASI